MLPLGSSSLPGTYIRYEHSSVPYLALLQTGFSHLEVTF